MRLLDPDVPKAVEPIFRKIGPRELAGASGV